MLFDEAYKSHCDVTASLAVEHELSYGKHVFVVDILYHTVEITLCLLYRTLKATRTLPTEAEFIDALRPHF